MVSSQHWKKTAEFSLYSNRKRGAASCPPPYASRHAYSRTDASLFWTCIKIAKAFKDFHGRE